MVQLPAECGSSPTVEPVVGRIQKIFSQKFSEESYDMVHSVSVNQDLDSGLWWTNIPLQYSSVILPVKQLSPPLVVAREESKV